MKITIQPRREEALRAGFAALLDRLEHGYSFEAFCAALNDWEVRAFCADDKPVGMLMLRGPELHVAVLPEVRGRWLSRRLIREVFEPIFEQYGEAVTDVAPDNARGLAFVNRIREGFASGRYDPTTVLTSVGGSLISGALQGGAAESAADTAAAAQNRATDTQMQMFQTQNAQQAPYRQAGTSALGLLAGYAGVPGYQVGAGGGYQPFQWLGQTFTNRDDFRKAVAANYVKESGGLSPDNPTVAASIDRQVDEILAGIPKTEAPPNPLTGSLLHQFNAEDLKTSLAPNYEWIKGQGIGSTQNLLNASGGAMSGNTLKGITDYATNLAGNAYQQAFGNFTTNQTNIFNRLATIAGLGQTANAQSGQLAGALAPGIAASQIGAGQAQAAGTMGAANALAGGGSNALGWYQLGNLMNPRASAGMVPEMVPGQFSLGNPAYG